MREPTLGELDKRITIRRRLDIPAGDMGLEQTFPAARPRWAKIEPVGTAAYAGSVQIEAVVTHRIYVRYLEGVTTAHEVVHGQTVYRLRRSMHMNGGRRFTALEVEELGNG